MKVGVIGLGKLGLPIALAIESRGHQVCGYDVNSDVRAYLDGRKIPYREEGLQPLLDRHCVQWCESIHEVVEHSDIVFVAIQTPHGPQYEGVTPLRAERADFDYTHLKFAVHEVAQACAELESPKTVVVISTCLPGTFEREIAFHLNSNFDYAYSPLFIAMGSVLADYLYPEFNLIGVRSERAADQLEEFFSTINSAPCVRTDITTAEGIKCSYNTIITAKTVIANAWGELSERLGMNFTDIKKAWDLSTRRLLSSRYLDAGMSDGGGCFPAGELVMTRDGMRPIEEVMPGDDVLTAAGTFMRVVKQWERNYEGPLVVAQIRGLPPVRMTPEHPVLVRQDGRQRVPDGRRNTARPIATALLDQAEVRADDLDLDSMVGWPHIDQAEFFLYDTELITLAGWYLAEGSVDLSSRRGRLRFDLHAREEEDALDIERCLLACAIPGATARGSNARVTHCVEGNSRSVRFGNHGLASILVDNFGKGAADKSIPRGILWGDLVQIRMLLRGLIRGDGHRSKDGVSYSTISEQLAWGVFICLHRLGLNPTIRDIPPRGNHKRAFEVRVRNRRLASELCGIVGWEPYGNDKEIQTYADDGATVWRHVQKLDLEFYSGPVYNLWVEGEHTYVVGCGAVHNCHPRDNIALSWLANEVGMSHNFWDDLMTAREEYERWHAELAIDAAQRHGLPLVILGRAFKPETDIETGSAARLMTEIAQQSMSVRNANDLDDLYPAVYFIATKNERYRSYAFPPGSVVIDPFGYMPDRDAVTVRRLGRQGKRV